MKRIIAVGILLVFSCALGAQTRINYTGAFDISDLKTALDGYDAGSITILPSAQKRENGQEFFLESLGKNTVINYTTANSLDNAIYTLLDKWGFRWYGPADGWFIKPQSITDLKFTGRWIMPRFRNRLFFGTGGLDEIIPGDSGYYKKHWNAWKRRIRINADYQQGGHIGMAFYQENKALCDAHPEWFSSESGKQSGRLKIEKPDAVKAFKNWVRKKYDEAGKAEFINLNVEPEDGRGGNDDPLPPDGFAGIKNWNNADKWWWLANEVAKDYLKDSRVKVGMYAYGDGPYNARVPKFKLLSNVDPMIIPYAFQRAYLPAEMVKKWSASVNGEMGIYDYWNISQWSLGLPQNNPYWTEEKLKFWKQNKINSVNVETTDAVGPINWWLYSKLLFDGGDVDSLLTQYCKDCFGAGWQPMKKMYKRWYLNYQGASEPVLSAADISAAKQLLKPGSDEMRRLEDVMAYIKYLELFYTHDGTQQSKDNIFQYLYAINKKMLVQTSAFVGQYYITPLDKGNITPKKFESTEITSQAVNNNFNALRAKKSKGYQISSFQFDYSKAHALEPVDSVMWNFGGFSCNFFFFTPGDFKLTIGAVSRTKFVISKDDGIIKEDSIGNSGKAFVNGSHKWLLKDYSFKAKPNEKYYYHSSYGFAKVISSDKRILFFKSPGAEDFDNYAYPPQYFYMPGDVDELVFYDAANEGVNGNGYFYAPDGTQLHREQIAKNVYKVPVKTEWKNKVWRASFGHPSFSLLNIPNITTLQKFEYRP